MDMVVENGALSQSGAEELRATLKHAIRLADEQGEALIAIHIQMALDKLREGKPDLGS